MTTLHFDPNFSVLPFQFGIDTKIHAHPCFLDPVTDSAEDVRFLFKERCKNTGDETVLRVIKSSCKESPRTSYRRTITRGGPTRLTNQIIFRTRCLYSMVFVYPDEVKESFSFEGESVVKIWDQKKIERGQYPQTLDLYLQPEGSGIILELDFTFKENL